MTSGYIRAVLLLACAVGSMGAGKPVPSAGALAPELTAGDSLFGDGRFSDASTAYEREAGGRPMSATALAALARIRLYQHRENEAADLARRAMALEPDNPVATKVLRTADSRRATFGPNVYQIETNGQPTTVDFVITDPLPVVRVRVDGRPAAFLIDTGAPDIALKPAFAKAAGLSITEGGVGVFAGGRQAKVERTTAPDLEIGGINIRNVPAAINPAELHLPGVETDGVIGTGLLMHFLATIDYCHGKLVLAPRSASTDFERGAAAAGANIVSMWLVGDHFLFARGRINQAEGLFSIDTGLAGGGLVATKATVDAAGLALDKGNAGTGQGGGGAVHFIPFRASATLGALTRDDIPGVYMPEGDPYGMFPFKVAGALSHSFFRQSRVTFDFDAMKLVTERCEPRPDREG